MKSRKLEVLVTVLSLFIIMYSILMFSLDPVLDVSGEDLTYLESLGFKNRFYNTEDQMTSKQYEDLVLSINGSSIYGYERKGTFYQDLVVTGFFYMDAYELTYSFDVFPQVIEEDGESYTYSITITSIDDLESIHIVDEGLIKEFEQFIDRVEPIVNHSYITNFVDDSEYYESFNIFDETTYKVKNQIGDYTEIETEFYDNAYLKGNLLFEKYNNDLWLTYYIEDTNFLISRYGTDEYVDYMLASEGEAIEQLFVSNGNVQVDFINPEILEMMNENIHFLNEEYEIAQTTLL